MSFASQIRGLYIKWSVKWELTIKRELIDQGHVLTGKLVQSIKGKVKPDGFDINMSNVSNLVNYFKTYGIDATRKPGGAGHKSSPLIQGLIRFFKKKGLSPYDAKRAAFATGKNFAKRGSPSRAGSSYGFSTNGRRTLFRTHAKVKLLRQMNKEFREELGQEVDKQLVTIFRRNQHTG